MSVSIDTTSYDKAAHYPQRHGYQLRGGARPSSIIIHTTSNRRPTAFETEADYLFKSADVSSHFLISKTGIIIQFLAVDKYQAWHAGQTLPDWANQKSIGIENHVSVGESWTPAQEEASTWLARQLMAAYGIPSALVDTHRAVALPKGRKQDPAGMDDAAFYAWRAQLIAPPPQPPAPARYRVRPVMVSQRSEGGAPYAGELHTGDVVDIDAVYPNGFAHLASGLGFVRLSDLEVLQ